MMMTTTTTKHVRCNEVQMLLLYINIWIYTKHFVGCKMTQDDGSSFPSKGTSDFRYCFKYHGPSIPKLGSFESGAKKNVLKWCWAEPWKFCLNSDSVPLLQKHHPLYFSQHLEPWVEPSGSLFYHPNIPSKLRSKVSPSPLWNDPGYWLWTADCPNQSWWQAS